MHAAEHTIFVSMKNLAELKAQLLKCINKEQFLMHLFSLLIVFVALIYTVNLYCLSS